MSTIIRNKKYPICLLITALIIFGARTWPAVGPITAYGMTIVGIFVGVIFGYCTIGMILPSFMAFLALGFSGWGDVPTVMQVSLGNQTVLYIISILLLSAMFEQCGLAHKLVNWFITRKFTKGRPWIITLMFMLAAYWAAWFISAIPPTFICWALLINLFEAVGYKHGDKWPMTIMFGVLYAACLGSVVPSFQIGIAVNYGMLTAVSGGTMVYDPLNYMGWAFICSVVLFAGYFLFAKYVIRPDVSLLQQKEIAQEDTGPLTGVQKVTCLIFIVFVVGLLLPSVLPADNIVRVILNNMGSCGWGLLMVLAAVMLRVDDKAVFPFESLFAKGIMWDIVLMMATMFTLAAVITGEETGIPALLNGLITPLNSAMGTLPFIMLVSLIIMILGNLTNTVAVSCTLIPILYVAAQSMDLNLFLMVAIINLVDNICLLVPSASVYAAMMYSKQEWIPMKWCLIFAVFVMCSIYAVVVLIGIPLGSLFFV